MSDPGPVPDGEQIEDGEAVEEIQDNEVAAPHLAAVQDLYEEAMARLAGLGTGAAESGPCTEALSDPQKIDMSAVKVLRACGRPSVGPEPAWSPAEPEPARPEAHDPDRRTDPSAAASALPRRWSALRSRLRATG